MGQRRRTIMKYCPKCNRELPETEFTKDRTRGDGLRAYCRECYNAYLQDKRPSWRSRSPEAKRQEWQRYIAKYNGDPTKRDRDARYRLANAEKIEVRSRTYHANREAEHCSVPGCGELGERHHLSYQDPSQFVWLCRHHHLEEHA